MRASLKESEKFEEKRERWTMKIQTENQKKSAIHLKALIRCGIRVLAASKEKQGWVHGNA